MAQLLDTQIDGNLNVTGEVQIGEINVGEILTELNTDKSSEVTYNSNVVDPSNAYNDLTVIRSRNVVSLFGRLVVTTTLTWQTTTHIASGLPSANDIATSFGGNIIHGYRVSDNKHIFFRVTANGLLLPSYLNGIDPGTYIIIGTYIAQ